MFPFLLFRIFVRLVVQFIFILVCGFPLWLCLLLQALTKPQGFWENFVLYGFWFYAFAFTQTGLVLVLLIFSYKNWASLAKEF